MFLQLSGNPEITQSFPSKTTNKIAIEIFIQTKLRIVFGHNNQKARVIANLVQLELNQPFEPIGTNQYTPCNLKQHELGRILLRYPEFYTFRLSREF